MRLKWTLLALFSCACMGDVDAQNEENIGKNRSEIRQENKEGRVSGSVVTKSGDPIAGVTVHIKNGKFHQITITDQQGNYEVGSIPLGKITVEISYVSYDFQKKEVILSGEHNNYSLNFILNETKDELQSVIVTANNKNKFYSKNETSYINRMPLKNLETPQVFSVVTKELLQDAVVTNMQDALSLVPGVSNIGDNTGSGATGLSMRVRGFSTQINMRNGAYISGLSLSDPQLIERIEVIKGPTGTLYGSYAGDGSLVNKVTKKPFKRFGGSASYAGGSWDMQRAAVDINAPFLKDSSLQIRINAVADRHRTFQDAGDERAYLFAPSVKYDVSPKLTLSLDAEFYNNSRNQTSYSFSNGLLTQLAGKDFDAIRPYINRFRSYTNNDIKATQSVYNLFLSGVYKISEAWTSNTFYSIGNADYRNRSITLQLGLPTGQTSMDSLQIVRTGGYIPSNFSSTQLQQNFVGDFKIGQFRNRMVIGLDYSYWYTNDNRTGTSAALGTFKLNQTEASYRSASSISLQNYDNLLANASRSRINRRMNTYAAYISDAFNITDQLILSAGIRVDKYAPDDQGTFAVYKQTAWSPKFGLVYEVVKDQVSLFANYLNGFSNNQPQTTAAGESIDYKPTQTNQSELGVKFELLNGLLNGNVSYYHIIKNNILRADPNSTDANPLPNLQDDKIKAHGVDFEMTINPMPGLNIMTGYSYSDIKYQITNEGKRMEFAPKQTGLLWASYRFTKNSSFDGFGIGMGGNYSGDYFVNATNTFAMPSYTVVNASVFYDKPRYRISLKANNISNEDYWVGAGGNGNPVRPQNPRQYLAQILFKF